MPILLDTCAALWIVEKDPLNPAAAEAISRATDRGDPIWISPITGWQVGLLARRGKFKSRYAPQRWLDAFLALPHVRVADLPPCVLLASCFLPGAAPRDPSDRIIAATAREYGFVVVTRDRELLDYAAQGHIAAEPC
ncbi:MAG: type II toxin-antitoxin system VapC family toxin [Rhizomicrobium sp.]